VGALAAGLLFVGCSGDDKPAGGSGGSGGTPAPVTCGTNSCTAPEGSAAYGISACCLSDNACGLLTPFAADKCLPPDQPGGLDQSCDNVTMDTTVLRGCCGADGKCGAQAPALGCIAGDALGSTQRDCVFEPDNDCAFLTDLVCDGPEDCGLGQQCCGHLAGLTGGVYDKFACATSCDSGATGMAGMWLEFCHPGQMCAETSYTCLAFPPEPYFPDFLYRCGANNNGPTLCGTPGAITGMCVEPVTSGPNEISCGDVKCGTDEKCCLRPPHDPYCAPADSFCECITSATNTDGGI
jgi:hypothetical protein